MTDKEPVTKEYLCEQIKKLEHDVSRSEGAIKAYKWLLENCALPEKKD